MRERWNGGRVRHNKGKDDWWYEVIRVPADGNPQVKVGCRTNEVAIVEMETERMLASIRAALRAYGTLLPGSSFDKEKS